MKILQEGMGDPEGKAGEFLAKAAEPPLSAAVDAAVVLLTDIGALGADTRTSRAGAGADRCCLLVSGVSDLICVCALSLVPVFISPRSRGGAPHAPRAPPRLPPAPSADRQNAPVRLPLPGECCAGLRSVFLLRACVAARCCVITASSRSQSLAANHLI